MSATNVDTVSQSPAAAPLPRWKKWLFGLVVFTLVVGVLQGGAYVFLRQFKGYDGKHLVQHEFDPYKNLLPTPNYVDTRGIRHNSVGFRRSSEVSKVKPPGTVRIFLMGGSTAYGLGGLWPHIQRDFAVLRNEETIDAYLERRLNGAFPGMKVEVINAAITSTWTHHNLIYLYQTILGYDPDMVLSLDGCNDFYQANPSHDQFRGYAYNLKARVIEGDPTLSALVTMNEYWLFRKFALAHVAGLAARELKTMLTPRSDPAPTDPQARFAALQEVFPRNAGATRERIGVLLQHEGILAVFLLQPQLILDGDRTTATPIERRLYDFNVRSYPANHEAFMRLATPWIVGQQRAMAQRVGATFLDLTTAYRGVPGQVYSDYCHLTPHGNDVLAGVIAQHITPLLRTRLSQRATTPSR